ncbi:ankyrin repeat-containing domain protein, partial [Baffinella frigidus]
PEPQTLNPKATTGDADEVERLLAEGAHIQEKTRKGSSPLHCAILRGRYAIVQFLLDKGADCNARTNDGDSCLAFATAIGSVAVVHQLMDMGAEVNLTGEFGLTPLHWAATRQDEFSAEIVTMLLEKGADLSARDGSGETPADLA